MSVFCAPNDARRQIDLWLSRFFENVPLESLWFLTLTAPHRMTTRTSDHCSTAMVSSPPEESSVKLDHPAFRKRLNAYFRQLQRPEALNQPLAVAGTMVSKTDSIHLHAILSGSPLHRHSLESCGPAHQVLCERLWSTINGKELQALVNPLTSLSGFLRYILSRRNYHPSDEFSDFYLYNKDVLRQLVEYRPSGTHRPPPTLPPPEFGRWCIATPTIAIQLKERGITPDKFIAWLQRQNRKRNPDPRSCDPKANIARQIIYGQRSPGWYQRDIDRFFEEHPKPAPPTPTPNNEESLCTRHPTAAVLQGFIKKSPPRRDDSPPQEAGQTPPSTPSCKCAA